MVDLGPEGGNRGGTIVAVGHQPDCTEIVFALTGEEVRFPTAAVYEVQWSKKRYPFTPEPNPQNQNALARMVIGAPDSNPTPATATSPNDERPRRTAVRCRPAFSSARERLTTRTRAGAAASRGLAKTRRDVLDSNVGASKPIGPGAVVGEGAQAPVLRVPPAPGDAVSQVSRERVIEWYRSTLVTRPDDKQAARVMVVMQRIHVDDLVGYLLDSDAGFEVLSLFRLCRAAQPWRFVLRN